MNSFDLSVGNTNPQAHSVKAGNENVAKLITVESCSVGDVFLVAREKNDRLRTTGTKSLFKKLLTWRSQFENLSRHTETLINQMRTKTLLLTAALSAAGVATSMAQVFSVNAVGYVTTTVPKGKFALISNPLTAANNTIGALFAGAPAGTQIFKFDSTKGSFTTATYDDLDNAFVPAAAAALTVVPGEGVFVKAPAAADVTVTFVGEVPQGNLSNPLPKGLSIRSSMVPQAGDAKALGLKGEAGDQVFQFSVTDQKYLTSTFDDLDNDWSPKLAALKVGEAFFLSKQKAGNWDRAFNVNQ